MTKPQGSGNRRSPAGVGKPRGEEFPPRTSPKAIAWGARAPCAGLERVCARKRQIKAIC
jgi:hypothetical protein